MALTARSVMTVPDGRHAIEPKLSLVVKHGGTSRVFVFRYQLDGIRREITLGSPPDVTLTSAKEQASVFRAMLARGVDPRDALDRKKEERRKKRSIPTLEEYYEEALHDVFEVRGLSRLATQKARLAAVRMYALPVIGSKRIDKISTSDVAGVLKPIWSRQVGADCKGSLEAIFAIARRDKLIETMNPAVWRGNLDAYLPPQNRARLVSHHQAPTLDELRRMLEKLKMMPAASAKAILFGALTVCRSQEWYFAESREIDMQRAIWSVAAIRRKDRRPEDFLVPLSTQAVSVIQSIDPRDGLFFATQHYKPGIRPFAPAQFWVKYREGGYKLHGIRATFSTWCGEKGIDPIVREKCLMHTTEGAVAASYMRSDYLDQRREVLQAWADEIMPTEYLS